MTKFVIRALHRMSYETIVDARNKDEATDMANAMWADRETQFLRDEDVELSVYEADEIDLDAPKCPDDPGVILSR